jgi:hypothetical protein
MLYGTETARMVLAYKGPPRNIINKAYEDKPDPIVGKMTIRSLDQEMFDFENHPPDPGSTSRLVSLTEAGSPHNHSLCPKETGRNNLVNHLGTPINPQGFGRKINIGGEGETKYLGFEDFVTDSNAGGPPRPLTDKIPDSTASDILYEVIADNRPRSDRDSPHRNVALSIHLCDKLVYCSEDIPFFVFHREHHRTYSAR